MSNRDDIQRRLQAAIQDRQQRDNNAAATRSDEAQAAQQDYEAFAALVDRVILPAMTEFREMLEPQGVVCRISESGVRGGNAYAESHAVRLVLTSEGRLKVFGDPQVEVVHFPTKPGEVFINTNNQPSRILTSMESGGKRYDDVTQDWILDHLTKRFEEAMKDAS